MLDDILRKLVDDAMLVADVGVRLGRLGDSRLLTEIGNARVALATSSVTPEGVTALQIALSDAIKSLYPITFSDLRNGWRPYGVRTLPVRAVASLGTTLFFVVSVLLAGLVAYTTLAYDRGRNLYAATLELQQARGAEQAIRLLGLMKKNQQDVVESLKSGKKDFLYETFAKALFDLELANTKYRDYQPFAADVLQGMDIVAMLQAFIPGRRFDPSNPTDAAPIAAWGANYTKTAEEREKLLEEYAIKPGQKTPLKGDAIEMDVHDLLEAYLDDIDTFNRAIGVTFDLKGANDYSFHLLRIRDALSLFGTWLLPSLYGMLGAVVFQMRRLLDPNLPNPSWLRFTFRVILGGFAGVILVSLFVPSQAKLVQPEFATLTSFGAAFIVGFSTDVFFQWLDRLVMKMSQMAGEPVTR